ncbi:MAG: 50S ribosomal protein L25 [Candidatus Omnitrophica bacterium]|nr:50S ribosomal protein L25 [Candidatus Omnitrophota bacterium]MCM8826193.1 50S ribosomal protein L25 [Candidatus Omnitrophota bacterium]
MEKVIIKSILREGKGKEKVKKIRRRGFIPAIVYSRNFNLPVELPLSSMKILKSIHFSENTIIEMEVDGYENKDNRLNVLIKDVQYDPLREEVIHIDFMKVSLDEKVKVKIPIVLKGESKGVKEGGVLEQIMWDVTVEALPLDIPEKIEVDISHLGIGDTVHIVDLKISEKVRILASPEDAIVTVVAKEEEVVVSEEVTAETAEPEVIKEKPKEEKEEKEEEKK